MSSIIPFRSPATDASQTDDLRNLLASGTEAVSLGALAYERLVQPVRDWTNQEMADLARVQYLLSRAGVHLETERGLTDEGDPWFVFCDAGGEVFVHVCRMGMTYLLDSPSLETPLRGLSFDALVNSFIERATTKAAALNVVPLDKNNKVLLHPAVMLAALVWSLYLLSDQMTNAAYASGLGEKGTPFITDEAEHSPQAAFVLLTEMLQEERAETGMGQPLVPLRDLETAALSNGARPVQSSAALPQAPVVSSLSAIALALGFWHPAESLAAVLAEPADIKIVAPVRQSQASSGVFVEAAVTDVPREDHAHAVTLTTHHDQIHTWSQSAELPQAAALFHGLAGVTIDAIKQFTLLVGQSVDTATSLQFFARDAESEFGQKNPVSVRTPTETRADTGRQLDASARESLQDNSVDLGNLVQQQLTTLKKATLQIVNTVTNAVVAVVNAEPTSTASKALSNVNETLLAALGDNVTNALKSVLHFDPNARPLNTAETKKAETVETTVAEPVKAPTEKAADTTPVVKAPEPDMKSHTAPPLEKDQKPAVNVTYNSAVEALVLRILDKKGDVLIIQLDKELVIIDKTSLDEVTDQAYAHSWTLEGGNIVSTVGHYADYKELGLLS